MSRLHVSAPDISEAASVLLFWGCDADIKHSNPNSKQSRAQSFITVTSNLRWSAGGEGGLAVGVSLSLDDVCNPLAFPPHHTDEMKPLLGSVLFGFKDIHPVHHGPRWTHL